MGVGVAAAAVAHGATVIEKHFTLRRAEGGVDSAFSLEPHEMRSLVVETERAWQSLGAVRFGAAESEEIAGVSSLALHRRRFAGRRRSYDEQSANYLAGPRVGAKILRGIAGEEGESVGQARHPRRLGPH